MKKNLYRYLMAIIYIITGIVGVTLSSIAVAREMGSELLIYFTNITNYLCLLYVIVEFTYNLVTSIKNKAINYITIFPEMKFCLALSIFMVAITANTLLGGQIGYIWTSSYWTKIDNPFYHFALPILFIWDYFFFSDHHYTLKTPLKTLILPGIYAAFIIVRAIILGSSYTGTLYPYDFLNPHVVGYPLAIVYMLCTGLVFIFFGYTTVIVDHYVQNKEFRKNSKK